MELISIFLGSWVVLRPRIAQFLFSLSLIPVNRCRFGSLPPSCRPACRARSRRAPVLPSSGAAVWDLDPALLLPRADSGRGDNDAPWMARPRVRGRGRATPFPRLWLVAVRRRMLLGLHPHATLAPGQVRRRG
ncbi:hypothetical protein GQ55_9G284200 [Panicum hallii var. hallii]|uniref:Uncharacterized protein n=1 Tax=Panicum hallii var. hallii TaxID=1504633 RepID=A0A2T7C7I2_9POAL|nr:hypothetical protein GQ55_9G284200 [Panicum hallii var. hallii]